MQPGKIPSRHPRAHPWADTTRRFLIPTLGANSWLFAGLLGLMVLVALCGHRLIRGLLILTAFAFLVVLAADVIIFDLLNQRWLDSAPPDAQRIAAWINV